MNFFSHTMSSQLNELRPVSSLIVLMSLKASGLIISLIQAILLKNQVESSATLNVMDFIRIVKKSFCYAAMARSLRSLTISRTFSAFALHELAQISKCLARTFGCALIFRTPNSAGDKFMAKSVYPSTKGCFWRQYSLFGRDACSSCVSRIDIPPFDQSAISYWNCLERTKMLD